MKSGDTNLGYELSEEFPVSRERVFNALTDADVLKKIWGVQRIEVDARVGGKTIAEYIDGGVDWSFTRTYTEIVPNRTLGWIAHFNSFPTMETIVTVPLEEAGNGT